MKVVNAEAWNLLKAETESRVAATVDFAERWADKMEEILGEGFPIRQAMQIGYKETNHPAFVLGAADSAALILRDCWIHGPSFFKAYAKETGQSKLARKIDLQERAKTRHKTSRRKGRK